MRTPSKPTLGTLTSVCDNNNMVCPLIRVRRCQSRLSSSVPDLLSVFSSGAGNIFFPVASCTSHVHNSDRDQTVDCVSSDTDGEALSVPGLPGMHHVKRKMATESQPVNELEIKEWLEKETGLDRIRKMYSLDENSKAFVQDDTRNMNKIWYRTNISGFFINLITTALAKDKESKAKKNLSATSAISRTYDANLIPKTALKEALVKTIRLSIWSGSLIYVSQTIAAYRNKSSVLEYVIASTIGFGTIGVTGGIKVFASYTAFGALFGFLVGNAVCKLMMDYSITQEVRHSRRIAAWLQDQRLAQEITGDTDAYPMHI